MSCNIRVEKASDGTFIISVPPKPKKDNKEPCFYEDIKYTAKNEKECLRIVGEALKDVKAPEDEYGIGFEEAEGKASV